MNRLLGYCFAGCAAPCETVAGFIKVFWSYIFTSFGHSLGFGTEGTLVLFWFGAFELYYSLVENGFSSPWAFLNPSVALQVLATFCTKLHQVRRDRAEMVYQQRGC